MAEVSQRTWRVPGTRTKRKAWGYSLMVNGRQVRSYKSEWTKEEAQEALAKVTLGIEAPPKPAPGITFGQASERYLQVKSRKRSVEEDRRLLGHLKAEFGVETPLVAITASRISAYKGQRLAVEKSKQGRSLSIASINRPLALLPHLLRLACEEWEVLAAVPKIKLEKETQGTVKYLEPDAEHRLLEACRASRNSALLSIVTVALETGLQKGELLGLEWSRVDFSRGVIRLEITKSGKRREVPMRQVVHDILSGLPGPRLGRVWRAEGLRTGWERAVEEAKLDDFHFHDCRHHFASWYMMRGGSLKALQEVLGHADIKMTMKYAHLSPDHLRAEMLKTERAMATPQPAASSAQGSAQEPSQLVVVSGNIA